MEVPKLSVVLASINASELISACLDALLDQAKDGETEVIIADCSTDGTDTILRDRYPSVRLLHWNEVKSVPQLRGEAIAVARGEIIAILDPYCIVQNEWVRNVLKLHASCAAVSIGGSVELDSTLTSSYPARAIYFNEYADFAPPIKAGFAQVLPGNNIAYKRAALGNARDLKNNGFWKSFHNMKLNEAGEGLWSSPLLSVKLNKPIPFVDFFSSRYHHGRCFGAMRVVDASRKERWLRILSVPFLPPLFLWRQFRSLWPKRRYRDKFLLSLPWLFLLAIGWSWGELWGYLRGPGRSCSQLFY